MEELRGWYVSVASVVGLDAHSLCQFVLHPTDTSNDLQIWCRDSQVKIKYGPTGFLSHDPSHLSLDLLRTSHLKMPARLSKEVMLCLTHGGVHANFLEEALVTELAAEFSGFSDWSSKGAMLKIWDNVARAENVLHARMRREALGASRALGYGERDDAADIVYEVDGGLGSASEAWAPDLISGLPSSLAETVMAFLASGFLPEENPVLHGKLTQVIKTVIRGFVERFKVPVQFSAEGFAIPGELSFSGQPFRTSLTSINFTHRPIWNSGRRRGVLPV